MATVTIIVLVGCFLFFVLCGALLIYMLRQWNIPTVIFRYQGDKRRPMVVMTKSRKTTRNGVSRLFVRGYKQPLRDFKSENYYPYKKGKNGALVLWEPKPSLLTPAVPSLRKVFGGRGYRAFARDLAALQEKAGQYGLRSADFSFDESLYSDLLLKAVDDTDIDFLLQEYARVDSQYTTGWRDFLAKYGSHMVLVIITVCLLTGFIVWLDKAPEQAAVCANAAVETTTNVLKEMAASGLTPPG